MINAKEMRIMDDITREKARAVFARLGLTEEQAIELFISGPLRPDGCLLLHLRKNAEDKEKRMNERFAEWDAF